jgi:hypothetical protein
MYIIVKVISAETIPGMGEGGHKGEQCGGEFKHDIFDKL